MFDLLLRRVLLRGLPPETIAACASHPEIRALLRFRFVYLFAFHAPVLVPLLEALSGRGDPALSVLSLGVASLSMVLADVPTGLYADRAGPKAALRLGLLVTALVMLGFFVLGLVRAFMLRDLDPHTVWLPGVIGVLILEIIIGVSLALLSGADTVLFLRVAQRSGIPGLERRGFEGIGSAIRYLGTMFAVGLGAALFDLTRALIRDEAWRFALQNSLFLLTFLAQLLALRDLRAVTDEVPLARGQRARPGLRAVARALVEAARFRGFFGAMWLLCMSASAALFAVYLFQSPLNRLTADLARQLPILWPLYTVVAMAGYWACARGSHAVRIHHHDGSEDALWPPARSQTLLSLGLLALYPVLYALARTAPAAVQQGTLLAASVIICLLFNYARGFNEPYSATALIAFTERRGHEVPASVISGFNSLKRGAHFLLSVVFFIGQRGPGRGLGTDARLALTLSVLTLFFALALLPAWRRADERGA